eukprot:3255527-Pleurochrysis_carterae.AAC.2
MPTGRVPLLPRSNERRRESVGGHPLLLSCSYIYRVLPISAVRTTVVASSTPATAAASVATSTRVPAAASAAVASSSMFHATSPGDDRTSWPPKPIRVPPSPPPVFDELKRALHAVSEEEVMESTREYTRRPIRDPV